MSVTTTSHFPITLSNTTGHLYYTINYRVSGTSEWTEFNTSGTTISVPGLDTNILYDFQVINVNNTTNPASAIVQSANITDPAVNFSVTNNSITLSWPVQSSDITGYTTTIAVASNPSVILATHNPAVSPTVTDTFSNLFPFTKYILNITSFIGTISHVLIITITTTTKSNCADPSNVTATLQ